MMVMMIIIITIITMITIISPSSHHHLTINLPSPIITNIILAPLDSRRYCFFRI